MKILLRNYPYVKVWSDVPDKGSFIKTHNYAYSLPSNAKYSIEITFFPTHTDRYGKETKFKKTMFRCILGYKYVRGGFSGICVEKLEPSVIDCEVCEFACKRGRLVSPIEYGRFDEYVCGKCGFGFGRVWQWGNKCPKCGARDTISKCFGNPHIHGKHWIFELHILDYPVSVALGEFLGVRFDEQLKFSCKGSWHNFRNDSSGFDICHVDCLNNLIDARIRENIIGEELFKAQYPEKGKILTGNNKIIKEWKNGAWI